MEVKIQFSVFGAESLNEKVIAKYGLGKTATRLYQAGMNEIYRVQAGEKAFYLRVSPHGFRQEAEIHAEMGFLRCLNETGVSVAMSVPMQGGGYVTALSAPEGERYAVLFEDAGGETLGVKTREQMRALGEALAKVHLSGYEASEGRKVLDKEYFIGLPMRAMEYYYEGTPECARLREIAAWLGQGFDAYEGDSFGVLHADPHNYNIRFDGDKPTLFDFDSFGYGPQMYDLGEQYWNISMFQLPRAQEKAQEDWLIEGYESVRPLTARQKGSISFFAAVRDFRLMGAQLLSTFRNRDTSFVDAEYARSHIDYLTKCAKRR